MLLFISSAVAAQKTYVPDDNFEAYLEANSLGDGIANNDSVTTSLIGAVDSLFLDSLGISDFTGIRSFSDLRTFYARQNLAQTIDLSDLPNLETFNVSSDTLDTLKAANCSLLSEVILWNYNLDYLNLENCTSLFGIYNYGGSSVSTLILNNSSIYDVQLSYLQLQNFEATNCPLSSIDLSYNQLTNFDVSGSSISLSSVNLEGNQLTSLNFNEIHH